MRRQQESMLVLVMITAFIATALILPGLAGAGSLEPPASAVDGSGNPVPTRMTPPSWSQKLDASERFEQALNDSNAILDKETGLVWWYAPWSPTNWQGAHNVCFGSSFAGRKGWRIPTVWELTSLIDPTQSNPALPNPNPFYSGLDTQWLWTSNDVQGSSNAWRVRLSDGGSGFDDKSNTNPVLCVRGGMTGQTNY
jgi:hypothetical protein